jgi:hypothetical protein
MTRLAPDRVAHQRRRFLRHDAHRFLRHDWQRFVKPGAALPWPLSALVEAKANFDPSQPRVPAGHPDGGQWMDEQVWAAGTNSETDEEADNDFDLYEFSDSKRARLARLGSRPHGHHYVSFEIHGRMNLSAETRKVFDEAKTGPWSLLRKTMNGKQVNGTTCTPCFPTRWASTGLKVFAPSAISGSIPTILGLCSTRFTYEISGC